MSLYAWIGLIFTVMLVIVTLIWRYLSREIKWFKCRQCGKLWNENGDTLPSYIIPFPDAESVECGWCQRERLKERMNYAKRN